MKTRVTNRTRSTQHIHTHDPKDVRLFNEINLLRLEGYYFCLDPKEAAKRTNEKYEFFEVIRKPKTEIQKRPVVVVPNPRYGYPSVLAYKILQAIMQRLSSYAYPLPDTVHFTQRELARLVGRNSFGGWNQEEFYRSIRQLRSTEASYWFYDKVSAEWSNVNFQILDMDVWSGREHSITHCAVRVNSRIVESLNNRHALCLNYARMGALAPIGVALYKRIFFHFSNLYSLKRSKEIQYTKSYAAVCTTWLGGLKVLRYESKILREQLGRHLDALKATTLIAHYTIEKNAKGDGFNLVFSPGEGFFEDYERFYLDHLRIEQEYHQAEERKHQEAPLKFVEKFYKRLYHRNDLDGLVLMDKEVDFARTLLETYAPEEIDDLVAYTFAEAQRTRFPIRNFGGVKVYLNAWLDEKASRAKRAAVRQQRAAAQQEQRLRDQYDLHWRQEVGRLRAVVAPDELAAMEEAVTADLIEEHQNPLGFDLLVRLKIDAILAERYAIPSFEQWRAQN